MLTVPGDGLDRTNRLNDVIPTDLRGNARVNPRGIALGILSSRKDSSTHPREQKRV